MINFKIEKKYKHDSSSDIHYMLNTCEDLYLLYIENIPSSINRTVVNSNGYGKVSSLTINTLGGDLEVFEAFLGIDSEPLFYAKKQCINIRKKILLHLNENHLISIEIEEKNKYSMGKKNVIHRIIEIKSYEESKIECVRDLENNNWFYDVFITPFETDYLYILFSDFFKQNTYPNNSFFVNKCNMIEPYDFLGNHSIIFDREVFINNLLTKINLLNKFKNF